MTSAFRIALFIFLLSPALSYAVSPNPPDVPDNYVVDLAGVIGPEAKSALNSYLSELETKTTAQMVVLTIDSLDGEDIEGFSIRTAEKWKIGQKGKDNGVLLSVAIRDRKYRFEIGYGLESILPDGLVGSIGRQYMVPYFRKGDYGGGITSATLEMIRVISAKEGVEITGLPAQTAPPAPSRKRQGMAEAILPIIFFIVFIYLFIKHPRLLVMLMLMSGRRGAWGGGRGFGGGGFSGGGGGFGGGGGGGFGGGGSSGSW